MKKSRASISLRNRKAATAELVKAIGERKVIRSGHAKYMASFDSSKLAFEYNALVQCRTEKDVEATLSLANRFGVPVTSRGTGTSLTGSASPANGGWVLDLSRMKRIEIRKSKMMAVVQAGAVTGDIHKAAEAVGLFYPPDPSSQKYCTIGGNIACNAGGMRGAKYGVTRDYVVALEGFLPTGEKVSWSGEYRKFATGYNIRDLWIGSEGTLGVITKAVLKLIPKPEFKWTMVVAYETEEKALQAVQDLLGERVIPSILEFLDTDSVFCAEEIGGIRLFKDVSGLPLLLVECDGSKAQIKAEKAKLLAWAKATGVAYKEAKSEKESEKLWEVRRKCSSAMFALGDAKLNEDIVVPLEAQLRFAKYLRGLKRRFKLPIATFGHAADGNFHVNIMYHRDDPGESNRAEGAVANLMKKVLALGGTISGEHGIGLAKTPFMELARSDAEMNAMKAVKNALDPKNILNPGKIFEPYETWKHRPEKVRLPWDKERPPTNPRA